MLHGKATWLLSALMMYSAGVGAATREEVERFRAAQQPETVVICRGEGSLQTGKQRITITTYARQTVLSVRDGRQRSHTEYVIAADGVLYARYAFDMVSWLSQDAEISEIDPESILISLPTDEAEASETARFIRANGIQRLRFKDFDASHFPEWDTSPAQDDSTGTRYHCAPVRQED